MNHPQRHPSQSHSHVLFHCGPQLSEIPDSCFFLLRLSPTRLSILRGQDQAYLHGIPHLRLVPGTYQAELLNEWMNPFLSSGQGEAQGSPGGGSGRCLRKGLPR